MAQRVVLCRRVQNFWNVFISLFIFLIIIAVWRYKQTLTIEKTQVKKIWMEKIRNSNGQRMKILFQVK